MRRIGIFGGTFDPPHLGHLTIAEWAREALALDRVVFVPAGTPPHKRPVAVTPAVHRLAMTRLAARGHPAFEVTPIETRRRGPSYTVDTLRRFRAEHPRARLFLIVGEDSLDDFGTWRDPHDILALSTLVVAGRRAGRAVPARAAAGAATRIGAGERGRGVRAGAAPPEHRVVRLDSPVIDLSSSEIRARLARGRSVRYLVPDAVLKYAARQSLYRRTR